VNLRKEYICNDALKDLEVFFKKHVKNQQELEKFLNYLDECRNEQRIGFRFIHEELMQYRESNSDYFSFSEEERKMVDDLFHFWG
jgi:hypothetical protein